MRRLLSFFLSDYQVPDIYQDAKIFLIWRWAA
jgi:hypothetical protein